MKHLTNIGIAITLIGMAASAGAVEMGDSIVKALLVVGAGVLITFFSSRIEVIKNV